MNDFQRSFRYHNFKSRLDCNPGHHIFSLGKCKCWLLHLWDVFSHLREERTSMSIFMSEGNRCRSGVPRRAVSSSPHARENFIFWNYQLFGVQVKHGITLSGSGNLNGSSPVAADYNSTCPRTEISRKQCHLEKWKSEIEM